MLMTSSPRGVYLGALWVGRCTLVSAGWIGGHWCCLVFSLFSLPFLILLSAAHMRLDQLKGMSSCKLQLHHALYITLSCRVMVG